MTGKLSADGTELTILAAGAFDGSYAVATTTDIKTVSGADVAKFESVVPFEDEVRPTVSAPVYKTNNVATISFSEPVDLADNAELASALTLKDASGATFTPSVSLAADKKSFTLDLNAPTFAVNKAYQLTIAGVKDFAGNLITPNPVTVTVEKKVVDEIAPTVSTISSSQAGYVVVNFSEKVAVGSGNVVATINGIPADLDTNASLDASGTVLTVRDASFNGVKDITVSAFADLAGNPGTAKTSLVSFPVDSVRPVVSSSAVKVIDNKNYLVLTFSEDVVVTNAAGSITGTYVTENGVEKTMAAIDTASAANVSLVEGTKNQVKILIDSQEKGRYSVSLPAGIVTDVVGNANLVTSASYTVTANTAETDKPTINTIDIQSADNNTVTIEFSEALSPSSLNLNNFLVEGVAVAEKAVFTDTAQDTIKLTLKKGAINVSGTYNFTVRNVADLAGNVMLPVTQAKEFTDNKLPSLTSAILTSNNFGADTSAITLTFDEAIASASIVDGEEDFKVFVDGVAITATVTEAMGTKTNQVVLNLNRALTPIETSKVITIKPGTDFEVLDLANNALVTFDSVTVSK